MYIPTLDPKIVGEVIADFRKKKNLYIKYKYKSFVCP